ncbi:CDP-alcohol phosphatidyltransferase family protein [Martelella mangrovi]|uniref:Phosphatidylglycerophosphate synthase n=1 Tax=Martelella mangrovi TaxID=1397477 RepID=A0ABV2IAB2_9HYPH
MSTLEPPSDRQTLPGMHMPAHGGATAAWRERHLLKNTLAALAAIYVVSIAAYLALAAHLAAGPGTVTTAALALLAILALVIRALPGHEHRRFGPANIITAIRASMVSFFGAAMIVGDVANGSVPPVVILLVVIALALDGIDGYLARRTRLQSAFGGRFDMEVDALLILLLSVSALLLGKAGGWVLAIGLMRYGFVLAQTVLPFLKAPLAPSFRRKLICVVQVAALCLILLPGIVPPASTAIAAIALALISYSFAADIIHLARQRFTTA